MIEQTKRRVGWFHWAVLFVGITLIVYSQSHDTVAVEVPVQDSALIQRLQDERDQARHALTDYKALVAHLKLQVKTQNALIAQHRQEWEREKATPVPPQPIILEAVRSEASTPAGFRDLVAKNFGEGIAKRVRVVNE